MKGIKKKAFLLGMLADLTTISLVGCGEKDNIYRVAQTEIKIQWEDDNVISGVVPYDDIFGNIKVVILEQNGTIKPFLMIKELISVGGRGSCTNLSYIDLKTGLTMLQYKWNYFNADVETEEPDEIVIGKYLNILEEQEFYNYLVGLGEIRTGFDVNEIIDIYNNEIEPDLLEHINEEYNYTK